jgi:YaiO family outer membrane protein
MKNRLCYFLALTLFIASKGTAQTTDSLKNAVTLTYNYYHFNKQFTSDWQIGNIEYKRQTKAGAFLGRFNYANRLQQNGWQAEAEAYPVLSKKVYAYAGIGYSGQMPVFPKWRSGASLFVSLPKAWEVEGGFRQLYFDKNIWIGTAGVSKYAGSWLLNFRSYISMDAPVANQAYFFTLRNYFKNEKDYAWLQLGSGISPDEARNVQLTAKNNLSSRCINAGSKLSLSKRTQMLLSLGYWRNEYGQDIYGNQFFGAAGISHLF